VINVDKKTTVITGMNGAGKTSLLEAIYIALRGTSFKGTDADVLLHDAPWWRIDIATDDDAGRSVLYDPSKQSGKKQFIVHEKKSYRLSPKDKYPVVLFEPEDLRLLHGSPSRRRDFIDRFLTQLNPTFATTLRKYDRALKQRNTLLKRDSTTNEDLFVWNVALSEYGAEIIEQRIYAVELINKELTNYYQSISHTNDTVSVHYSHTSIDNSVNKLLKELEKNITYDKAVKHTSVGPHRHDVLFRFNNSPALSVASRGEVRSIMLALKKIEVAIIEAIVGLSPIILLDDVYSELDEIRQKNILSLSDNQIIITTTAQYVPDVTASIVTL
jgi:DNA replication and repair protein RecF